MLNFLNTPPHICFDVCNTLGSCEGIAQSFYFFSSKLDAIGEGSKHFHGILKAIMMINEGKGKTVDDLCLMLKVMNNSCSLGFSIYHYHCNSFSVKLDFHTF